MKLSKLISLYLTLFLFALICYSCEEQFIPGEDPVSPRDFTHLSISLTSGSSYSGAVNINIKKVFVLTDKSEEEIELSTFSNIYNLTDLQNGIKTILAESDLMGIKSIFQIRLVLGENNSIVVEEVIYPLMINEDISDLLKVHCNIRLDLDLKKDILLDFNAEKSIFDQGSGIYLLRPDIRIMD